MSIAFLTPPNAQQHLELNAIGYCHTSLPAVIVPPSNANDKTIPTTEWVQALLASRVMSLVVQDYLLEQNGYVRFRFGLTIQWGFAGQDNTGTTVFPLPFKSKPTLVIGTMSTHGSGAAESWTTFQRLSSTQFEAEKYASPYKLESHYIAIGTAY